VQQHLLSSLSKEYGETDFTDVQFIVGTDKQKKEFSAHQLILGIQSPVFKRMFLAEFKEKQEKKIVINDLHPDIFGLFLQFLYTGVVILNPSNVLQLLDLSRKYELKHLEENCVKYVEENITNVSVGYLWDTAHLYELQSTQDKCWAHLIHNTAAVFNEVDFSAGLSENFVQKIVDCAEIECTENELFDFVVRWIQKTNQEVKSEPMQLLLKKIRFEQLSPLKLAELTVNGIIEDKSLILAAFAYQAKHLLPHMKLKTRKKLSMQKPNPKEILVNK